MPHRTHPATAREARSGWHRSNVQAPLTARLRYRFDRTLAHGPLALVAWLAAVVIAVVVVAGVAAALFRLGFGGGLNQSLPEELWQTIVRSLDTGTFANDTQWPTRLLSLIVTLSGIFLAGALIGLIANAIDQRVDRLQKGRSRVLEQGHTLILGWSPQLAVIVRELVAANENVAGAAIVILSGEDKMKMETFIHDRVGDVENTRVVCRRGNPASPADLELVNAIDAKSIIVLAGEGGDAEVVKTVLAVRTIDPMFARAHVVAEVQHPEHAHTLEVLTDGAVVTVNSDHVIAEVTAQACHQAGLSFVFRELLDFEGDEIYFAEVPELVGCTYTDALLSFERCSVIGRFTVDGFVELNPPASTAFEPGDQVIAVAEDDDKVIFTGRQTVSAATPASSERGLQPPVRVLIVGWSEFAPKILHELDEFLTPGSCIDVTADPELADLRSLDELTLDNAELAVRRTSGGPEHLLEFTSQDPFDQVVVLAYREGLDVEEADARTLLTLLTLRKLWPDRGPEGVRIIAELLDQANLAIASSTGVDDFIVSDALTSLMIAQLSERAELRAVFDDLFDPQGAVVELQPAHWYAPQDPVTFASVVMTAAAHGNSAFGYRLGASGRIVVNPAKSDTVHLGPDDQVLVIGLRAP